MKKNSVSHSDIDFSKAEIAELSEACREKIQQFERELNKQGYWNIALVAYQLKD